MLDFISGIILLAAFAVFALIVMNQELADKQNNNDSGWDYIPSMDNFQLPTLPKINPQPRNVYPALYFNQEPKLFAHGTSYENAFEIYDTNMWLVGGTGKIWMTTLMDKAKVYAGSSGAIVILEVASKTALMNESKGVFTYDIPQAKAFQEYYKVGDIKPVAILDSTGNKILKGRI